MQWGNDERGGQRRDAVFARLSWFGRLTGPRFVSRSQCEAESRALLHIIDEGIVLANAAEDLLAKFGSDTAPGAADARFGLQLRLAFVNLLGPLKDLHCCPEHTVIQNRASELLNFYLHMITRSFELRFSLVSQQDYTILGRDYHASSTYLKLMALRSELGDSLADAEPGTIRLTAPAESGEPGIASPPRELQYRRPGSSASFVALAAFGVLFVAASIVGASWAQSASTGLGATCGDLGCQSSEPFLYTAITAAQLAAPPMLAAGVIWAMAALLMSRLIVGVRVSRRPARTGGLLSVRVKTLAAWMPAVLLLAASMIGILYVSSPTFMPGAHCVGGQCTVPDNYAFIELVHLLAPAALLAGLICLLIVLLVRSIPQADTLDIGPDTPRAARATDATAFMRPADLDVDELR
jgi:hypothetical protein